MEWVIYNSTLLGFFDYDTLVEKIGIDTISTYWITGLREKLADKSHIVNRFRHMIDSLREDTVLIKFWGQWCAPCLRDNKLIQDIIDSNRKFPYIVGVQNDKVIDTSVSYRNILDPDGFIARSYDLNAYPLYILRLPDGELARTNRFEDIVKLIFPGE